MVRSPGSLRTYDIDDLARESGCSRRTIAFYREIGVLPRAHGRGPTAFYTDQHLNILLRIRRDRDERRTLADWADALALGGS